MITEQELARAKQIVQEVIATVNNDREEAARIIFDMCLKDPELQKLFAKVGAEIYESSIAVKH
jgi:hypothetical protein